MDGLLIVMSGFSGAGKGTLLKSVMSQYDNYVFSVSMTTRSPREGEVDGKDYFFVDRQTFERTIEEDGLVEHAEYCGNYYGTPKAYIEKKLKEGMNVILDIEVMGATQIKKKFPNALMIYVVPPSIKILRERLSKRGSETKEVIDKRLLKAKEECEYISDYEYIIVNDDLEEAKKKFINIVDTARQAVFRNNDFINELKQELESV
jgi:guanylate kinase